MHSTCVLVQFSPVRGGNDLVNTRSGPVSSRCHSRLMANGGIRESQLPVQVWCGCLVFTVVSSSLSHFPQERVPIGNSLHSSVTTLSHSNPTCSQAVRSSERTTPSWGPHASHVKPIFDNAPRFGARRSEPRRLQARGRVEALCTAA